MVEEAVVELQLQVAAVVAVVEDHQIEEVVELPSDMDARVVCPAHAAQSASHAVLRSDAL